MITHLKPHEVFVFGSNLLGVHGAGAAKTALDKFGAIWGQGVGLQGKSYAIPTKDRNIITLPISEIKPYVDKFIKYAEFRHDLDFLVTEIGCGLANLTPEQVAPLFKKAQHITNIYLPERFKKILEQ